MKMPKCEKAIRHQVFSRSAEKNENEFNFYHRFHMDGLLCQTVDLEWNCNENHGICNNALVIGSQWMIYVMILVATFLFAFASNAIPAI